MTGITSEVTDRVLWLEDEGAEVAAAATSTSSNIPPPGIVWAALTKEDS
jgi:hypothetical protein